MERVIVMAKVRIQVEMLRDGVADLMKSDAIVAAVDAAAKRIERAAGPEFHAKPAILRDERAVALVVPVGRKGRIVEAREKRLSKAVTACRS